LALAAVPVSAAQFGAYYTKIDSGEAFEKSSRTGPHAARGCHGQCVGPWYTHKAVLGGGASYPTTTPSRKVTVPPLLSPLV